jgi:ribose/xylose/arabinose/galactoside ABC-type transport system permease subunit
MKALPKNRWKAAALRHESILLIVTLMEWCYFNFVGPRFGTIDNSFDILRHSVEIGMLALAMTPVILAGAIDLSVGSLLGLCAVLFGKLWRDAGLPIPVAAACTLVLGGMAGGTNAVLVTRLRVPPLIVTLGTFSLFRGLAEALTRGVDTFTNFPTGFLQLGQERTAGLPTQVWIFGATAMAIWTLVHRTTFGRSLRANGFAPEGARYAGLPVRSALAAGYILTGLVAAMAAILYTARVGQAKADAGTGYELLAITSVVLGGTSIFGGVGSVHGTLVGVAAIAILNNGLVHARQPREVAGMLTSLLLIVALCGGMAPKYISERWIRLQTSRTSTPEKKRP